MSALGITFVRGQFFLNHPSYPKNPYKEKKNFVPKKKERKARHG